MKDLKQKLTSLLLALTLGISGTALATVHTPVEDGQTWMADACWNAYHSSGRDWQECCEAKCHAAWDVHGIIMYAACRDACELQVVVLGV